MYFTNTPSLNSMEAMMKRPPGGIQRGGGRKRSPYKYTGRDCDCRLCLYYRKKDGCTVPVCPVLDIRLACGAASVGDAVKAVFKDIQNTTFQKRLSKIYRRKDDVKMIFQNNRHKQLFEAERSFLRKPGKKVLAVLYLLTSDHIDFLDHIQMEMATARQFLFIARLKDRKEKQTFEAANRIEKTISEQGFEVRRMKKADIKRFLALYFEASMNGESMPDTDGGQFYEADDDEDSED